MEFFKDPKINFVGAMKPAFTISATLVLIALVSLVIHGGPHLSIDFTGGSVLQVRIDPRPTVAEIRSGLENENYRGVQVTSFGAENEFLITFPNVGMDADGGRTMDATQLMLNDLRKALGGNAQIELRREESVGPKIGGELRTAAMNSIIGALALIVLYITVRFVFRYGIAAILALVHDVTLTLGVFSLLNFEVSLQIIAAFLTIIGYSLNDTIVVFDRIRENMKLRRKESYRDVINRSINECLSRTILTSLTTFFVAAMLYVVGGPVIHDFAFALSFGVVVGTYSSIFIASPILVWWYERRIADKKRMAVDM
ncbi:MAG TPA: protein translocase subunit SecF [Candidatus Krumholzibacteria bacterium]|nr:protein translocase subunit SecF [Candidatus Krumholzibacteria bacterium]